MKPVIFGLKPYVTFTPKLVMAICLSIPQVIKSINSSRLSFAKYFMKDPTNYHTTGHHVYVNSYYNSPQLAEEMKKSKTYLLATILQD